ncbi:hypothetical protein GLOIN_2v1525796 [Rhizophagus clarus]|uniref:Uncharacterized protein n=1 Tax=Rhizophagus clarus TaxID=94130 RepID=A0A8H3QQ09_9GLOM|nr:hypothetical protein GLOIN_2v1525796 [Rhizophagus clarus]
MNTPGRSPYNVIIFVIIDLIMDFIFYAKVREVERLYIPNTIILMVSLTINTIFVIYVSRELHSLGSNVNSVVLLIFTILSSADVETLNILQSYDFFENKFSDSTTSKIFWVACLGIFIEDIPQVTIQVLYILAVGYFDTITTLIIASSCTALTVHVIGRVLNITEATRSRRLIDADENNRLTE